ncbi:hypothetical protein [Flavobacterium sp.]|jgi:hypothetical protein|uniref:hypothetical protein n=1 Tax=Flavobacterium sp. TaxID=239 RepID=UPI0037BE27BA
MKKSMQFISALLLFSSSILYSQQINNTTSSNNKKAIRVNLYGSYTFEDSFDSYYDAGNYYQGQLQDGMQYGAGVEFEIHPNTFLELSYLRQDTNAPTQYYNGGLFDKYADFDVTMNYIMLGGNHSFRRPNSQIEGFGGLMAGMAIIDIKNPNSNYSDSVTKFAWGAKGGAIIWATKAIGVKLQAQLLSVTQSVGGGIAIGTGGVGAGVSSYSSIYQFSLGGGLVFALGQ